MSDTTIPLIIGGRDIVLHSDDRKWPSSSKSAPHLSAFQGATPELVIEAVETAAAAFPSWAQTPPAKRRELLLDVAKLLRNKSSEARTLIEDEIYCSPLCAQVNFEGAMGGHGDPHALVFKEPLGVVLGIAPWNAPLILGLRAVVPVVAAGNVAILKGSELSPRTHHFIASLFREASFPPGVVNFLLHRPQDAGDIYDTMIKRPEVRKCNFTGSTQVGRNIASKAALALKPVLLERGGKNFSLVLADADLDPAAEHIVGAAFLNNGQICMSTDLVYVVSSVANVLIKMILEQLNTEDRAHKVISAASISRLTQLVNDAKSKGAVIHQANNPLSEDELGYPATIIEGLTPDMALLPRRVLRPDVWNCHCGMRDGGSADGESSPFGLSAAIFTRNHFKTLELSKDIRAGAIHGLCTMRPLYLMADTGIVGGDGLARDGDWMSSCIRGPHPGCGKTGHTEENCWVKNLDKIPRSLKDKFATSNVNKPIHNIPGMGGVAETKLTAFTNTYSRNDSLEA